MAKRKGEAQAEVLDMVPMPAEVQETSSDGRTIVQFLQGLAAFFGQASELERAAVATLTTAQQLKAPENSVADEVIQKFVKKTSADKKAVEAHWGITSVVHQFHRRLTAKRDIAVKALTAANEIGNRLHNGYVQAETRRAEAEERRRREEAEFQARELQRQELDRLEAEALAKEESAPELSERESRFVELFSTGTTLGPVAARIAGFKDPGVAAARLLGMAKIQQAVKVRQEAAAIRRQAEARARMPLEVEDVPEVKPDVTKAPGASDRTTKTCEVYDAEAFVRAAISGQYGIPWQNLEPSQAGLNASAREMGNLINRWPGVRFKETTRVV